MCRYMCIIDTVENGIEMVMWIGQHAPPELVMNVFGVNSQAEINVDNVCSYIGFISYYHRFIKSLVITKRIAMFYLISSNISKCMA